MIAFLQGILTSKLADRVEIDVHGIGYEVFIPRRSLSDLPPTGRTVTLKTHLHVREDVQQLYGFLRDAERQAFLLLLSVSGVGPKAAMGILSALSAEEVYRAVLQDDHAVLRSVPGVGPKTAQHIVLEIKEKVVRLVREGIVEASAVPAAARPVTRALSDALQAFLALGYSDTEARRAVAAATESLGEKATVEEILKVGLKSMGA
jgi:Holliday junction DNA helicase RuvA